MRVSECSNEPKKQRRRQVPRRLNECVRCAPTLISISARPATIRRADDRVRWSAKRASERRTLRSGVVEHVHGVEVGHRVLVKQHRLQRTLLERQAREADRTHSLVCRRHNVREARRWMHARTRTRERMSERTFRCLMMGGGWSGLAARICQNLMPCKLTIDSGGKNSMADSLKVPVNYTHRERGREGERDDATSVLGVRGPRACVGV